jgi:hypothetical protein
MSYPAHHRFSLLALLLASLASGLPAPLLHALSDCCHSRACAPAEGPAFSDECPGCEAGIGSALAPLCWVLETPLADHPLAGISAALGRPCVPLKSMQDRGPPSRA